MKILLHFCVCLVLNMTLARATPELDALEDKIRAAAPGPEWKILKDWHSITLSRKSVQFLNPISLPGSILVDEIWKEFAFTSDYRITVTLDTKLTQSEYDRLVRLQHSLKSERTAGSDPKTKDHFSRSQDAEGVIRLPSFYIKRYSVYVYTSDDHFFELRPSSVEADRDKVLLAIEKLCSKHVPTSEQDGGGNAPKPPSHPSTARPKARATP